MCGIIGFTGRLEAQKIMTEGLAALEYRDTIVQVLLISRIQARFLFAKPSERLRIFSLSAMMRTIQPVESDIQDGQHTAELPMPMLILTRLEMSHSSTMVSLRTTTRS